MNSLTANNRLSQQLVVSVAEHLFAIILSSQ